VRTNEQENQTTKTRDCASDYATIYQ
jgi:hypothetical protein